MKDDQAEAVQRAVFKQLQDAKSLEQLEVNATRRCTKCQRRRNIKHFYKNSSSDGPALGRRSICKDCHYVGLFIRGKKMCPDAAIKAVQWLKKCFGTEKAAREAFAKRVRRYK